MSSSGPSNSGDVPTLLVKDSEGRDLLCFLEQLIPLDGQDYALLTPVDTPVCLFRLISHLKETVWKSQLNMS